MEPSPHGSTLRIFCWGWSQDIVVKWVELVERDGGAYAARTAQVAGTTDLLFYVSKTTYPSAWPTQTDAGSREKNVVELK